MKLKKILLSSLIFLSSMAFSQEKVHFDFRMKGEGRFNPKLGYFEKDSNEMSFSIMKVYEMNFNKINDSTYQEIFNRGIWNSRKEIFDYSFKDSCYVLDNYSSIRCKPRVERASLEGKIFDKKYKLLPEAFDDFENNLLKDSIHLVILGVPYSVKLERMEKGNNVRYFCNPGEVVEEEPGDIFVFSFPVTASATKDGKKIKPYKFFTRFKLVQNGKIRGLEGNLREE
ncbi:hypothetical protein KAI04_01590 [Candidatus Pacearchaeota archaeon]|nr:hypothetical protein [Candidatus Pacearchaeota archaeon]